MPIDFPPNPQPNDTYTYANKTWKYNGKGWVVIDANLQPLYDFVSNVNGITGPVGLSGSSSVTITKDGKTLIFTSLGGGIVGNYVENVNGVTGGVTLSAGPGISISPSAKLFTFTNTGVRTINGFTGDFGFAGGTGISLLRSGITFIITALGTPSVDAITSINGMAGPDITISGGDSIGIASSGNIITASNRGVTSVNGITGSVGISAGANITISQSGKTLTISSSSGSSIENYVSFINGTSGSIGLSAGVGITLTGSGRTFTIANSGVLSINGITANVGLSAGANVEISQSGRTLTLSAVPNLDQGVVIFQGTNNNFSGNAKLLYNISDPSLSIGDGSSGGLLLKYRFSTSPSGLFPSITPLLSTGQNIHIGTDNTTIVGDFNSANSTSFKVNDVTQYFNFVSNGVTYFYIDAANSTTSILTTNTIIPGNVTANNLVNSINGITGRVGLSAGENVTISQSGITLIISSSGGGGGGVSSLNTLTGAITATGEGAIIAPGISGSTISFRTRLGTEWNGINGVTGVNMYSCAQFMVSSRGAVHLRDTPSNACLTNLFAVGQVTSVCMTYDNNSQDLVDACAEKLDDFADPCLNNMGSGADPREVCEGGASDDFGRPCCRYIVRTLYNGNTSCSCRCLCLEYDLINW